MLDPKPLKLGFVLLELGYGSGGIHSRDITQIPSDRADSAHGGQPFTQGAPIPPFSAPVFSESALFTQVSAAARDRRQAASTWRAGCSSRLARSNSEPAAEVKTLAQFGQSRCNRVCEGAGFQVFLWVID